MVKLVSSECLKKPLEEFALHGESLFRLIEARIQVRAQGWKTSLERSSEVEGFSKREAGIEARELRRLEIALLRMGRLVPGSTCIHRSLAAVRILRRRGSPARVMIGLRREHRQFQGHAWVEVMENGEILRLFWSPEGGYTEIRGLGLARMSF